MSGNNKCPFNKQNAVWHESGNRCVYCGNHIPKHESPPALDILRSGKYRTVDHIVPKKHKGGNTTRNLVAACGGCNNRRGHAWPPSKLAHPDFQAMVLAKETWIRQRIDQLPKVARSWVGKGDEFQAQLARTGLDGLVRPG